MEKSDYEMKIESGLRGALSDSMKLLEQNVDLLMKLRDDNEKLRLKIQRLEQFVVDVCGELPEGYDSECIFIEMPKPKPLIH